MSPLCVTARHEAVHCNKLYLWIASSFLLAMTKHNNSTVKQPTFNIQTWKKEKN